jgi:toxin FitB
MSSVCAVVSSTAQFVADDLENRVLPFDQHAAAEAALIAANRRLAGRPIDFRDTQMTGIALARRSRRATNGISPIWRSRSS